MYAQNNVKMERPASTTPASVTMAGQETSATELLAFLTAKMGGPAQDRINATAQPGTPVHDAKWQFVRLIVVLVEFVSITTPWALESARANKGLAVLDAIL